jgi:hypothetical protein
MSSNSVPPEQSAAKLFHPVFLRRLFSFDGDTFSRGRPRAHFFLSHLVPQRCI